jgi:hypothetical protein
MLLALFLLTTTLLRAQDVQLVHNTFELDATGTSDTVIVPLKLEGLKMEQLKLPSETVYTVRLGTGKSSKQYRNALRVFKRADAVLYLAADLLLLNKAGTYEVSIAYNIDTGREKDHMKLLTLTLLRPAAILDTISTVYINVIGTSVTGTPFAIQETGGKAAINCLHLFAPVFPGARVWNLVVFPARSHRIPAGSTFSTAYVPNRNWLRKLPLGTTTGKIQIMAPEMSVPLSVPFVIVHKLSKGWIIFVVFLGLLAGALIRHLLKDRREWEILRLKGYQLSQRIVEETAKVGDPVFRQEMDVLIKDLNKDLGAKEGFSYFTGMADLPLATKIDSVTQSYNDRRMAFDNSINSVRETLKQLAAGFDNPHLDNTTNTLLAKATLKYSDAKLLLDKLNASHANAAIKQLINEFNTAIKSFISYHQSLTTFMQQPDFYPVAIPAEVKASMEKYVKKIEEVAGQLTGGCSDPELLAAAVNNVNAANVLKKEMMACLDNHLPIILSLKNVDPASPAMIAFNNSFSRWRTAMDNIVWNPQGRLDVTSYWSPGLVTALDKDWQLAKAAIPTLTGSQALADLPDLVNDVDLPHPQPFIPAAYFDDKGAGLPIILSNTRSAQKSMLVYRLIQTLFLSVLLSLIAYYFYGPTFIGTLEDFLLIFLFAFSIDITLDSVMQLKSGKIGS